MNNYAGPERRKFERIRVNLTLVYRVGEPLSLQISIGWETQVDALMVDISEGGMAIITNYNLPMHAVLFITFTLINFSITTEERIQKLEILGEVCSHVPLGKEGYRVGIAFTKINEKDKAVINNFIKSTKDKQA